MSVEFEFSRTRPGQSVVCLRSATVDNKPHHVPDTLGIRSVGSSDPPRGLRGRVVRPHHSVIFQRELMIGHQSGLKCAPVPVEWKHCLLITVGRRLGKAASLDLAYLPNWSLAALILLINYFFATCLLWRFGVAYGQGHRRESSWTLRINVAPNPSSFYFAPR